MKRLSNFTKTNITYKTVPIIYHCNVSENTTDPDPVSNLPQQIMTVFKVNNLMSR